MGMRLASIAIFVVFSLGVPARAQSFNRQDLDCAVAVTIENARADADKGTTREMFLFFLARLIAQDDETNWARTVYDLSQLKPKRDPAEVLAKCTELYQSSVHR
jgi:hypothetical protein